MIGNSVERYIKVMKALADPTRVKILKILQVKGLCVCEIRSLLGLAQPTISKHLKLLEGAGLVSSYKEKMWVHYRLTAEQSNVYAKTAMENLHDWLGDDPEIKDLQNIVPSLERHEIPEKSSPSRNNQSAKKVKTYFYPINKLTKDNQS